MHPFGDDTEFRDPRNIMTIGPNADEDRDQFTRNQISVMRLTATSRHSWYWHPGDLYHPEYAAALLAGTMA